MTFALAFFESKYGRYLLPVIAVFVVLFCLCDHFYQAGERKIQTQWDAQKAADAKHVMDVRAQQNAITSTLDTEHKTNTQIIYVQGKTIVQKVPVYIPAGSATVPYAFRVLHDAAASGLPVPESSAVPDGKAVDLGAATSTIVQNYTNCRADIEQLQSLQKWVLEQTAVK